MSPLQTTAPDAELIQARVRLRNHGRLGRDEETGELTLLFYGGVFSQWFPVQFAVDGIPYNCAEQYMMAQKARVFGDKDCEVRIMRASSPSTQKQLGKEVKGFDKAHWETVARDIVRTASLAKFSVPGLRTELKATGRIRLVEASPTDVIWGVGRSELDQAAFTKANWRGTNWLGDCLMDARRILVP